MPSSIRSMGSINRSRSMGDILDYNTLKKYNQENLCSIYVNGNTSRAITGIVDPEKSTKFSVSATYKPLVDQSRFLEKAQDVYNLTSAAWDSNPQVMINSLRLSEKNFKGFNAEDKFSISLSVPVMHPDDNPNRLAYDMLKFACGIRADDKGGSDVIKVFNEDVKAEFVLYAPNYYRIKYVPSPGGGTGGISDIPVNACTVQIGTRFRYDNVLINNVAATFSNTVYHDGKPTWLTLDISFEYWRQIDIKNIESFLMVNSNGVY